LVDCALPDSVLLSISEWPEAIGDEELSSLA
jgi:hypothetical protein